MIPYPGFPILARIVGGWRWWRSALLAAGFVLPGLPAALAVELQSLETAPTRGGVAVRLTLSQAIRLSVHGIPDASGTVSRLYVDLPPGTRLGRRVPRAAEVAAPLASLRVGLGEGGAPRIVLALATETSYRLRRAGDGRVVTLELLRVLAEEPVRPVVASRSARGSGGRPVARIVIDPGHGGHDPGAQGYAVEKEVTLAIARRLAERLRERLGAETILTRSDDRTLPLAARTARANSETADLFVSIHANASPSNRLQGIETYYLNNSNDRATIRLAAMENGLGEVPKTGRRSDLRYILSDLVQVGKMEESAALATTVQRALVAHLQGRHPDIVDLGVKQGPFYVLVGAYMPCVLVETSFLTHPTEGRRLAASAYQDAIAEGLYAGIAGFLADNRRARTL